VMLFASGELYSPLERGDMRIHLASRGTAE
jgi:hypothetical protein